MKKGLIIALIAVGSLFGLCLIGIGLVLCFVLTPARLTAIANKELPKFVTCETHIEKVDLTFFKTFPQVGLDLYQLTLINPTQGAPSDTLLTVKHGIASLNIRELLQNDAIILKKLLIQDGYANLFIDANGKTNFNVFKSDTTTPSSEFIYSLDLQKIKLDKINVRYVDLQSKMAARVHDLDLALKGRYENKNAYGHINLHTKQLKFNTLDSTNLNVQYEKLKFNFKGSLAQLDSLNGTLKIDLSKLSLRLDTAKYLQEANLKLNSRIIAAIKAQKLNLKKTLLSLNDYELSLDGDAQRNPQTGNIALDLRYKTDTWQLKPFLALIPHAILGDALSDLTIDGKLNLAGAITGHYNENSMPLITADLQLSDGSFAMTDFPLTFHKIESLLKVSLDLNHKTNLTIKKLSCYTGKNLLTARGTIRDLLGQMLFNLHVTGDLHLPDFKNLLPEKLNRCLGDAQATIDAQFDYNQLNNLDISHMKAAANVQLTDLDVVYDDTIALASPSLNVKLQWPIAQKPYQIDEWLEATVHADEWQGSKLDLGHFAAGPTAIHAYCNDLTDSTTELKLAAEYKFKTLQGTLMDSVHVQLQSPSGTFVMKSSNRLALQYKSDNLAAQIGTTMTARSDKIALQATSDYNEKESSTLMQWNPTVKLHLNNGEISVNNVPYPIQIPTVIVDFTPQECHLQKCDVGLGNSSFGLVGKLADMDNFFHKTGNLTGNLEFVSDFTDINQIMDMVSGFGTPDSLKTAEVADSTKEDNPFMVPYGVDVRLHTLIKKARVGETDIRDIGGHLSVNDGVLVLEEMGFTNEAARMQLTALYKSPRKNHLFVGFDFHLLDIKIDKLIAMIPQIDTLVPMLKSFSGDAEFHFAAETYLKSNYDLKYSTLRGAAAINGKDLVVLDNETYRNISKKLLFNKKTKNVIDSLSVEMTVYKNEIDVYPFVVSLDKYQAILSGRHNLDMTFDYNISLIKPLRVGLEISGQIGDLKYALRRPKYPTLFKPEKRNVVEDNIMQLKTLINQSLKANVKEQPSAMPIKN